jgi:hypothetical protein
MGVGAAVCAILALAGLNIVNIVLLIGLVCAVFGFLGPSDRKDRRLGYAGWGLAAWLLFLSVFSFAILAGSFSSKAADSDSPGIVTSLDRWLIALSILSGLALTVTAVTGASALARWGKIRYRLLTWSGAALTASYLFFPPLALYEAVAPPALGDFWQEPVVFGSMALGIIAGAVMTRAFAWSASSEGGPPPIRYGDREFLLFVVAFSLLLPRLLDLAFIDWPTALAADAGETARDSTLRAVSYVGTVILIPMIFLVATAGFLVSGIQAGWRPRRWLDLRGAVVGTPSPLRRRDWRAFALQWDRKALLTWRLPLLYGWLIILIAACSFLGYWGFLVVFLAAVNYLAMCGWERRRFSG